MRLIRLQTTHTRIFLLLYTAERTYNYKVMPVVAALSLDAMT